MTVDVIVVGGGLSGLAAATQLAADGAKVALVEQAGRLGGRTYSYVDRKTGDIVDNGQHILVGAYHHTLHYLELIGTRDYVVSKRGFELHFHSTRGGFGTFALGSLPVPLNFFKAAASFPLLSFADRASVLRACMRLASRRAEEAFANQTVSECLDTLHQSEESKRTLWFPISISVMNESPEKASALLFVRSIRNTFFGAPSDARLLVPSVGQTELYVAGAVNLLTRRRSRILLSSEVLSFVIRRDRVVGVLLNNGKRIGARAVISAIPPFSFRRVLPETIQQTEPFIHFGKLKSSPIVCVHLWFDREFMDRDMLGLVGRNLQWVFNRRLILPLRGRPVNYISAVISAAHGYVDMPKEKIVKMAVADLASAYPAAAKAPLIHSLVIKEKRATFSPTTGAEPLRPSHRTPIANLFLAGDWTNTGLPPTIEGAVLSGFRCAELARKQNT